MQEYKKEIVQRIAERLSDAKSIVLVNYKGVNIPEVEELRSRMRQAEVDYFVAKNTYIRTALKQLSVSGLDEFLTNETAVAVSKNDEVAPAKIVREFVKDVMGDKPFNFKAGVIDGEFTALEELEKLAKLPSKDELLAKMLSSMKAPISNFVNVNSQIIKKFMYAINAIAEKK